MSRGSRINKREVERKEHLLSLREPVDYCCEGCEKTDKQDISLCSAYIKPQEKWKKGGCFLATHIRIKETSSEKRTRVGQQKQKKKK